MGRLRTPSQDLRPQPQAPMDQPAFKAPSDRWWLLPKGGQQSPGGAKQRGPGRLEKASQFSLGLWSLMCLVYSKTKKTSFYKIKISK